MILENNRETSGMFSSAGKISFERFHVFQKKNEILEPESRKKAVIPYINVVKQLEEKFGGKLSIALNKQNTIEQQLKLLEMYEKVQKQDKTILDEKGKEPFDFMRTREMFRRQKIKKEPEPGTYTVKYSSVEGRIKSLPKFDTVKTLSNHHHNQSEANMSIFNHSNTGHLNESKNGEEKHASSNYDSNASLVNEKSQVYQKTKGSYQFAKMAGRSTENFMKYQPDPHENRFIKKQTFYQIKGGNRIKFDNFSGRYKKAGNKADFSTPSYNPNFDLVRKSTTSGILNFAKIAGRKDQEHEYYCKNQYNLEAENPVIHPSKSVPVFEKMHGRKTLKFFSKQ